jgi:hypothetical protein
LEKQNKTLKNMLDEWNDFNNKWLLLKLPCKIGDIVYSISYCDCCNKDGDYCNYGCNSSQREKVFDKNCIQYCEIYSLRFTLNMIEEIGKSKFITKQEAENVLNKQINL